MRKLLIVLIALVSLSAAVQAQDNKITLTLAGYAVPREAYGKIIPLFQDYWKQQNNGQEVEFQESYLGSGAQARAVIGGFEADVVALSLEADVNKIADAGLITHDWQATDYNGMVSSSVAVIVVRPDNPKAIQGWADLATPGIEVVTPDPSTSGGARWNVMAAYGAALRGHVDGYEATDAGALQFITDLFKNVSVLDSDGRASFLTFESGVGDAAITYENEYYNGLAAGGQYQIIYPDSTILIENPAAVVDTYVDQHGTRAAAEAFVSFLLTPEAQAVFAEEGFRPPYQRIASDTTPEAGAAPEAALQPLGDVDTTRFPDVPDLFIIDAFGAWKTVTPTFFGDDGLYTQMIATVKGQ